MTTAAATGRTVQVYRVFIKATPQAIWDAITRPEWTARYGYAGLVDEDLRPGGAFRVHANAGMNTYPGIPDLIADGEVVEADPPRTLVQTWRMLMTPEPAGEGVTRLTDEIEAGRGGVTKLTLTHELTGAPPSAGVLAGQQEAHGAGGGWSEVLSGLKTLLETGTPLPCHSGQVREG